MRRAWRSPGNCRRGAQRPAANPESLLGRRPAHNRRLTELTVARGLTVVTDYVNQLINILLNIGTLSIQQHRYEAVTVAARRETLAARRGTHWRQSPRRRGERHWRQNPWRRGERHWRRGERHTSDTAPGDAARDTLAIEPLATR